MHFLIPLLTAAAAIYAFLGIYGWLFPASVSTLNLKVMMPMGVLIYARNSFKYIANKLSLPQNRVQIINSIGAVIIITWLYLVLRPLYSPAVSLLWALAMIIIFLGCEYLGSLIDARRKKR